MSKNDSNPNSKENHEMLIIRIEKAALESVQTVQ